MIRWIKCSPFLPLWVIPISSDLTSQVLGAFALVSALWRSAGIAPQRLWKTQEGMSRTILEWRIPHPLPAGSWELHTLRKAAIGLQLCTPQPDLMPEISPTLTMTLNILFWWVLWNAIIYELIKRAFLYVASYSAWWDVGLLHLKGFTQ